MTTIYRVLARNTSQLLSKNKPLPGRRRRGPAAYITRIAPLVGPLQLDYRRHKLEQPCGFANDLGEDRMPGCSELIFSPGAMQN